MSESIQKLALGTLKLKDAFKAQQDEVARLEGELASLQKRAQAEEILLQAQGTNTSLRANDVEEFLAKRAQLEQMSLEELDKVAHSVSLLEANNGDITLSDYDDSSKESLNDWLRRQAANNY
jgi:regulator of protease activity HflC (stomatin/prohibitin superfamily)